MSNDVVLLCAWLVVLLVGPDWLVFLLLQRATRSHPEVMTLAERRWIALAIAVSATLLAPVALGVILGRQLLPRDLTAVVISVSAVLVSLVNLGFMAMLWRGRHRERW